MKAYGRFSYFAPLPLCGKFMGAPARGINRDSLSEKRVGHKPGAPEAPVYTRRRFRVNTFPGRFLLAFGYVLDTSIRGIYKAVIKGVTSISYYPVRRTLEWMTSVVRRPSSL
jgi:hypothetical protein